MIALAVDLAERQLDEGTASAQVITHYLKLGTTRERLEQEKIARENLLLEARMKSMGSEGEHQKRLEEALKAFRGYAGHDEEILDED